MSICEIIIISFSPIILVSSILIARNRRKKAHIPLKSFMALLLGGAILALFPFYFVHHEAAIGGHLDRVFLSLISAIHSISSEYAINTTRGIIFGFETAEAGKLLGSATKYYNFLDKVIATYISFLHLLILLFVGGFIISLFKNAVPRIRYYFSFGRLCVFAELSERSYLLAKNIRDGEKKTKIRHVIIFLNTANEEEHSLFSPKEIRELKAIFFNKDVNEFKIYSRFYHNNKKVNFFLLDLDDSKNLQSLFKVAKKYNNKDNHGRIIIHVLSDLPQSENIVDSIESDDNLNLRLIKESRTIFHELFDKIPLFLGRRENTLKILVIGAGRNGLEAVKIASWCGQTIDLRPEILVVDNNPSIEEQFAYDCPELAKLTATRFAKDESIVEFHTLDINSSKFITFLKKNTDIGYVVCALGDDELNLRASLKIRSIFAEINPQKNPWGQTLPLINTILNNNFLAQNVQNLKFDLKDDCFINPIGNLEKIYTWDNIVTPYLDYAGKAVNRFYEETFSKEYKEANAEEKSTVRKKVQDNSDLKYEAKEYTRSSSMAAGLHGKYKIYAALFELDDELKNNLQQSWFNNNEDYSININWAEEVPENLISLYKKIGNDEDKLKKLAMLEHRRWNVYIRSLGWKIFKSEEMKEWYKKTKDHRNWTSKQHACLVDWDTLENVDTIIEEIKGKKANFQSLDKLFVKTLPEVLLEAKSLDFLENNCIDIQQIQNHIIKVGVTGHRNLKQEHITDIETKIEKVLNKIKKDYYNKMLSLADRMIVDKTKAKKIKDNTSITLEINSCLSDGADRLVVKKGLDMGYHFHTFLPFSTISPLQGQGLRNKEIIELDEKIKKLETKNKELGEEKDLSEEQKQHRQESETKIKEHKKKIREIQKKLQAESQEALSELFANNKSWQIFGQDVEGNIENIYNRIEKLTDLSEEKNLTSLQQLELNEKSEKMKAESHKIYLSSGEAMLEKSDILIALWNGEEQKEQGSTYDIIQRAILQNKKVYWVKVEKE